MADLPIKELGDEAPEYDRPWTDADTRQRRSTPDDVPRRRSIAEALLTLVGSPDLSSRRWVWEQYDHLILGNTRAAAGRRCRRRARRGRPERRSPSPPT